jgi:hypothetical protein
MGRQLNRLMAKAVVSCKQAGLYCDGGGLYLQVSPSGSKTWIFRYRFVLPRKLRDMGLGLSQNLGHEEIMTTLGNYGAVSTQRQGEIMRDFAIRRNTDSPSFNSCIENK